MEQPEYDLMAAVEDRHWWWRARREVIAATIAAYAPPPRAEPFRVLEVGCGTGGNLSMMSQFGKVLGAEYDATALTYLKSRHGDRFEVMQHEIPHPIPGQFDIVGMFDVLEHIEDDAAALSWLARQVSPGGIAVLTVPAFPFLWSEHDVAARHFRRYKLDQLAALVPAEFELVHLTYFNVLVFPAVALVRMGLRLLPRSWQPRGTHMALPPRPLNWLGYQAFRVERHFAPRRHSAVGVSALLVLRRRSG